MFYPIKVFFSISAGLLLLPLVVGCGQDTAAPNMPRFEDDRLAVGRTLWMGTCRNCHLLGAAGAPAVTESAEWDRRLRRGVESLYESVLKGIQNADGSDRMPARGGNSRLTDEQVRMAVDFKLAAVDSLRAEVKAASDQ
ncbi:c-type cytochrome [Thiocapsa imhoffii]|nr:c-type cytochrome [Thiocapsa imhoffii]